MKEQVQDMFTEITMPLETENEIRRAMNRNGIMKKSHPVIKRIGAMAAVAALVLLLSPTARAAVNGWIVKYFWLDSDMTIYEMTDENGDTMGIAGVDTEAPAFARLVNGRLYFVGGGQKLDITDQITEAAPFFYTYVDEYGLTHYMAVAYNGSIENFGIYEFIRNEETGEWITGTGRNFMNPETMARYPWVEIIWEEWDIPWPMPE